MQVRFDVWDWLLVAVSVLAPGASAVLSQFAKASDGAINPGPLTGQVLAAFGAPIAAGVIALPSEALRGIGGRAGGDGPRLGAHRSQRSDRSRCQAGR